MSLTCNIVSALDKLVTLLTPQLGLVSSCMVDMIELDLFSMLPISVQSELLSMTEEQLGKLPTLLFYAPPLRPPCLSTYTGVCIQPDNFSQLLVRTAASCRGFVSLPFQQVTSLLDVCQISYLLKTSKE